MTRIFTILAVSDAVALVLTFALGCWSKMAGSRADPASNIFILHFYLGLYSSLGTLLVHCLIFVYFLGTGRWVKEVARAYDLPDEPWPKLTRDLKRRTFPPALTAMMITIGTSAAGAGNQMLGWPCPIHFTLGLITLLFNLWAFRLEYRNICLNGEILDTVLKETDRIRAERGLPPSEEAMREIEPGH